MNKDKIILEILREARKLIADPANWTKGANTRDAKGNAVNYLSDEATCFCHIGAIQRIRHDGFLKNYVEISLYDIKAPFYPQLEDAMNIIGHNDHPKTTHADVLDLHDRVIADLENRIASQESKS